MAEAPAPRAEVELAPSWRSRWGGHSGAALCLAILFVALAAPWLAPLPPDQRLDSTYRPPGTRVEVVRVAGGNRIYGADRVRRTEGGLEVDHRGRTDILPADQVANLTGTGVDQSHLYLLGSDRFGRDILSRLLYGSRISLAIGLASTLLALVLGVLVGSFAATGGPLLDTLLMRLVDGLLTIPALLLALVLASMFRPSPFLLVLILGGTAWMSVARLTRAEILSLSRRDFVLAARATGVPRWRILTRHLLPNALAPVLIQGSLMIGALILAEATLAYLGVGIRDDSPSWGNMIEQGQSVLSTAWWVSTFPGLAITVTVIAFNLLGDSIRDWMDPRTD